MFRKTNYTHITFFITKDCVLLYPSPFSFAKRDLRNSQFAWENGKNLHPKYIANRNTNKSLH